MVEQGIREEIYHFIHCYADANDKCMGKNSIDNCKRSITFYLLG